MTAGIVGAADLAGYRNGQVYVRRSMHVPPPREAVRDCVPALFEQFSKLIVEAMAKDGFV